MKIKIETIPTFKRKFVGEGKHTRITTINGNETRKQPTAVKQEQNKIFTILTDEHVAPGPFSVFWLNSPHHYDGSVFRCFVDFLYFWGITGNNHLTSATKHDKFERLMRGKKQLLSLFFLTFLDHYSGSCMKKVCCEVIYILAQS